MNRIDFMSIPPYKIAIRRSKLKSMLLLFREMLCGLPDWSKKGFAG